MTIYARYGVDNTFYVTYVTAKKYKFEVQTNSLGIRVAMLLFIV